MNIVVCVKQILDPEIPPSKFRIDPEAKRIIPPEGISYVMNPFDEKAVELALRIKEKYGGKIMVVSLGGSGATNVVKHAISMGADDGVVLSDPLFEGSDSFGVAYVLTKAIEKIGSYDLIICGRQSADWDEGLVGSIIAENLSLPIITLVVSIDVVGNELKIKRVTLDGYQIFLTPSPALVTVGQEVGRVRLPSGWGIISASRKKLSIWNVSDIGADPSKFGVNVVRRKILKLSLPDRERRCEMIEGETPTEGAIKLAERLREAGII
jgi:electron transfer flavoprotein beta subunit